MYYNYTYKIIIASHVFCLFFHSIHLILFSFIPTQLPIYSFHSFIHPSSINSTIIHVPSFYTSIRLPSINPFIVPSSISIHSSFYHTLIHSAFNRSFFLPSIFLSFHSSIQSFINSFILLSSINTFTLQSFLSSINPFIFPFIHPIINAIIHIHQPLIHSIYQSHPSTQNKIHGNTTEK